MGCTTNDVPRVEARKEGSKEAKTNKKEERPGKREGKTKRERTKKERRRSRDKDNQNARKNGWLTQYSQKDLSTQVKSLASDEIEMAIHKSREQSM